MEQTLHYRGVTYVVGIETDGVRAWSVRAAPVEGEADQPGQQIRATGLTRARGPRGSFKGAVIAARDAIDEMLRAEPPGADVLVPASSHAKV